MTTKRKTAFSYIFGSFGIFILGGIITSSIMCGELRRQQAIKSREIEEIKSKVTEMPSDLDNRLRRIEEIVARIDEKLKKK